MRKRISSHIVPAVQLLAVVVVLFGAVACKPSVPRKYIQPGKMEKILYDYHLLDAYTQMGARQDGVMFLASHDAILKKHGVTQAEFDSSMVYYYRYTERLHKIYENIAKRFSEESKSLGGNVNDYAALSAKGDTANIWQGNRSEILLPKPPHNKLSFAIKADTSFHQGDRILLNFKSQFIFQDGTKNAVATLSVRFRNDSIATQIQNFSSNGYTTVRIDDPEKVGIKEIRGYVSLINHLNDKSQTYKLLSIYDIQLIRMHVSSTHLEPGTERADDGMAEQPMELERNENLPIPHERPSANSSPAIPQEYRSRVAAPNVEQEQEVIEPDAPVHRERLPLPHKRR